MEENQIVDENLVSDEVPELSENTDTEVGFSENLQNDYEEGQANAPLENLILGKFKSVEDLSKAYQELEKLQGNQSQELGNLRKNVGIINAIQDAWQKEKELRQNEAFLKEAASKYSNYFLDPSFKEMYKVAYNALGANLDTDKFIELLEGYVSSRIFNYNREKSAEAETNSAINSMTYSKNPSSSFAPPQKSLDEMSKEEIDALLDKYI